MKIKTTIFALFILVMSSCSSKNNDPVPELPVEEESADAAVISYFHDNTAYYQPFVYRFDETTQLWGKRIASHFSTIDESEPSYLGFTNPYVKDSGVNLFQMVTLYADFIGTNNIKTAAINVSKLLSFVPDKSSPTLPDAPKVHAKGSVNVLAQQVQISKKGGGVFEIGISGTGTYDLNTGVIDLAINFDETAVGGPAKVTRKYKISKIALTL